MEQIIRGCELGLHSYAKYVYATCSDCGKTRLTQHPDRLCRSCSAKRKLARKREGLPEYKIIDGVVKYRDSCLACGKELWRHKEYLGKLCNHCTAIKNGKNSRGEKNGLWKGGRSINKDGYVEVVIHSDSPYFAMARKRKNTVLEHRLVMAKHLGRCLKRWEIVHHKNGVKTDNHIKNLELLPHQAEHICIQELNKRVAELEQEVRLLKWQMGILQHGNLVLSGSDELPKCVETIHSVSCN